MAKVVVILGFCLSFAAGLVVGWGMHKPGSPIAAAVGEITGHPGGATQPSHRRGSVSWWQAELGLSADQRKKLDEIWSPLAAKGRTDRDERRREYRRERDQAIADLVPVSQLGEYDNIINTYNDRMTNLERESREAYEAAVEQTKQILTPEQRTHYEDVLKRYHWGPAQIRERRPSTRRSETQPGTDPAAAATTQTPAPAPLSGHPAPSAAGTTVP